MNISILGGGSWGTALAIHLARNNHKVKVWEFVAEQAQKMQEERICPLLPQEKLSENIFVSSKMEEVLPGSEVIFVAVPSDKVESSLSNAAPFIGEQPIVICSKGFGSDLRLLSDVAREKVKGEIYCLYGPTHAEEICKGVFSGIVLAGTGKYRLKLRKLLRSENLKVELSNDVIGVQVGAALKNLLAVFTGVIDGAGLGENGGLGDNTKAYIMTKGLDEIKQVGVAWGAKKPTFYGLAGLGDVIVTCTSIHSRNHYVGEQVGKGRKLDEVLTEMKMVAEGIIMLRNVPLLQEKLKLKLPIMSGLYQIMVEGKSVREVLNTIFVN
ncbi:NAD(P)-dependent glycerol-3-phosphate dehydrogenase [Candidatus Woesearchaeota archaeon]|nr:NAD(P)-dependent glycerol-3-phosphate dehydrogenase [Candidatus Woesearchaeota archaeon]